MLPRTLLAVAVALVGTEALVLPQVEDLGIFRQQPFKNEPGSLVDEIAKMAGKVATKLSGGSSDNIPFKPPAPTLRSASSEKSIPNKYIVVLKSAVSKTDLIQHQEWITKMHTQAHEEKALISADVDLITSKLDFFNVGLMRGYVGYFPEELVKAIAQQTDVVLFLEQDSIMSIKEFDVQKNAPWGLSRVSHRGAAVSPKLDYLYDNDGGAGVTAYVIDTGIKVQHEEFEGRAVWGKAVAVPFLKYDGNGHGTHCAGIIGLKTYGVAKKVDLVAVSVMNLLGLGTTGDIIKGLEFVVADHNEKMKSKKFKGSTVNMSIGGGASSALDLAVDAGTDAGLHIAVAAGNENEDACGGLPLRAAGPLCVGATNVRDERASFSNWGRCVDIFAPGEDITLTYIWGESASMSGTSMAAPHITGLLSYYLSLQPSKDSEFNTGDIIQPRDLKKRLIKYGTRGVILGLDLESPNILAFNGGGGNLTEFWGQKI